MITFSTLGNHGRLGNLLFQYAALKSLSRKLNCKAKLPSNIFTRVHHGQKCLLDCFNIDCEVTYENELLNLELFEEEKFCSGGNYTDKFWECDKNTDLSGYFESENYFLNIKDEICNEYQLKNEHNVYVLKYIESIRKTYPEHKIIGIHIRRGDYLNPQNGATFLTTSEYNTCYLKRSFKEFSDIEKKIYIVFTGGSVDINNDNSQDVFWCKTNIKDNDSTIIYSENNDTIQDFGIMTLCDHLILNSSSTLGWWAAYLNKNLNKKIIVPKNLGFKNDDTFWPSSQSYIKL
jgi:hypothetical protein